MIRKPAMAVDADESARAFLGAALIDPFLVDRFASRLAGQSFGHQQYDLLWALLCDLRQAGLRSDDPVTIAAEAQRRGVWAQIGGAVEYARLVDDACLPANVDYHAQRIVEDGEYRRLERIAMRFSSFVQSRSDSPSDIQEWLFAELQSASIEQEEQPRLIGELIRDAATVDPSKPPVVPVQTGFKQLDRRTGGFVPGQFVLIAARPSIGKSAIGFQMAMQAAQQGHKALFISIEMSDMELAARVIASDESCEISATDVVAQRLDQKDRKQILASASAHDVPLTVWAPSSATVESIAAIIRCQKASSGCDIVFIDYLSLIRSKGNGPMWEKITAVTRAIKETARKLKVPIVCLSQVSRDTEKNTKDGKARAPTLSDLRYSGSLEQDGDVVLFLHRESRRSSDAELILAKGRNMALELIPLTYDGERFTFHEGRREWTG